jgi:hypothetical protein
VPFSDASNTTVTNWARTPILLDQVSLQLRVYQQDELTLRRKPRPEFRQSADRPMLDSPLAHYFSDPKLHYQKNYPAINICGKFVTSSNAVRIFRADHGYPIPHYGSKALAPHEKSIDKYEGVFNQFTDSELEVLKSEHPTEGDCLYRPTLVRYLDLCFSIRTLVIKKEKLERFNSLSLLPRNIRFQRMELYFEIPYGLKEEKELISAMRRILHLSFGQPNTDRKKIEESKDEEDRDAFLAWVVHPSAVSPKFKSKQPFKVKCYRKGQMIRFEIQANSPSMAKDSSIRLSPSLLKQEAVSVADEIATKLREVEKHALKALSCPADELSAASNFDNLLVRCKTLTPRHINDSRFLEFLRSLSNLEFTDNKIFKSFGLNPQLLKVLADPNYGFLVKQDRGIAGLNGTYTANKRNPIFKLEPHRLSLVGRPERISGSGCNEELEEEYAIFKRSFDKGSSQRGSFKYSFLETKSAIRERSIKPICRA